MSIMAGNAGKASMQAQLCIGRTDPLQTTLVLPMQFESSAGGTAAAQPAAASAPANPALALPARLGHILSLDDFERAARSHLPGPVFAYICGAVERNQTLRANAASFDRYEFVPRMLVDISRRTTATTLLGHRYS